LPSSTNRTSYHSMFAVQLHAACTLGLLALPLCKGMQTLVNAEGKASITRSQEDIDELKGEPVEMYLSHRSKNDWGGWAGLKIIGAGRARTGTESVQWALNYLGYNTAHGGDVIGKPAWSIWEGAYTQFCMDPVYSDTIGNTSAMIQWLMDKQIEATTDAPYWVMAESFIRIFDQAKVILTVHPHGAEGWMRSVERNVMYTRNHPEILGHKKFEQNETIFFGCKCRVPPMQMPLNKSFRAACKKEYSDYIDWMRQHVPAERLLVYNVTQGWAPLSRFLNKPIPSLAFPDIDAFDPFTTMEPTALPHELMNTYAPSS